MEDAVEKIKTSLSLSQVVEAYNVKLQHDGGTKYKGLCPFHHESTPSFNLDDAKGVYHCFGCNEGGDIISFVQKMENLNFNETIKYIFEKFKLGPVPNLNVDPVREKVLALNEKVAEYYQKVLFSPKAEKVLLYLTKTRNLSLETIKTFGLGFAPREDKGSEFYALIHNAEQDVVERSNIMNQRKLPFFYDRIMVPLKDAFGRVIGFSGRALNVEIQKVKYLNSPENFLFHKRKMLYNLDAARKYIETSKEAILVEGYFDVMGLWQSGLKNVVCSMGTALTEEQTLLLKSAETVNICYDGDAAGGHGTQLGIKRLLERSFNVKPVTLPSGDPDEYVYANGVEAFRKLLAEAPSYEEYIYADLKKNGDFSSLASKKRWLSKVFAFVKEVNNVFFTDTVISDLQAFLKLNAALLVNAWEEFLASGEIVLETVLEEKDEEASLQNGRREFFLQAYLYKVGEELLRANEDVFANSEYEETYKQLKFQKSSNPEQQFIYALLGEEERNLVGRLILEMPENITEAELALTLQAFRLAEKEKLEIEGLKEQIKNSK